MEVTSWSMRDDATAAAALAPILSATSMHINHVAPSTTSEIQQQYTRGSFQLTFGNDNSSTVDRSGSSTASHPSIDAEPWAYSNASVYNAYERHAETQQQQQQQQLNKQFKYYHHASSPPQQQNDELVIPPQVSYMDISDKEEYSAAAAAATYQHQHHQQGIDSPSYMTENLFRSIERQSLLPHLYHHYDLHQPPLQHGPASLYESSNEMSTPAITPLATLRQIDSQQYMLMMHEARSKVLSLASTVEAEPTTVQYQQSQHNEQLLAAATTTMARHTSSYYLQPPQIAFRRANSAESFASSSSASFHSASCSPMLTATGIPSGHWLSGGQSNCGSSSSVHGVTSPTSPLILSSAPFYHNHHSYRQPQQQQQEQQDYFLPMVSSPIPNTLRPPYSNNINVNPPMNMDILTTPPSPAASSFQSSEYYDGHLQPPYYPEQQQYQSQPQRIHIPVLRQGNSVRQPTPSSVSNSYSSNYSSSFSSLSSTTTISSVPSSPMMQGSPTNTFSSKRSKTTAAATASKTKVSSLSSSNGQNRKAPSSFNSGCSTKNDSSTTATAKKGKARYVCQIPNCHRTFSRPFNLKSHGLTHETQRPHACGICTKTFARIHDRDRHRKGHLVEKAHSCIVCLGRFARQDAVTRHLKLSGGQNPCSIILKSRGLSFRDAAAGRVTREMLGNDEEGIRRLLERLEEQSRRARANRNLEIGMMNMNMQMSMGMDTMAMTGGSEGVGHGTNNSNLDMNMNMHLGYDSQQRQQHSG